MSRNRGLPRRPRHIECPLCGGRLDLIDCGVSEHHKTRTRREQMEGRCPGRVYAHVDMAGAMECGALLEGAQPIRYPVGGTA